MRAGSRGLPPCSQASLEGDGALSGGTAQRKLLHHHFPYLVCLFEVISGKYDMAERAGALRAQRALGILCWDPAGLAEPRRGAPSLHQHRHTQPAKERRC